VQREKLVKVLVIGANGLIGKGVADELAEKHQVIRASRNGDVKVDINDPDSITAMFASVGKLDAIAFAAGKVAFKPLDQLTREDFVAGLTDKAIGQIDLVLKGTNSLTDYGSFTLMSGVLARETIVTGAVASSANGAIESFVMSAAIELPRGIRINSVSPSVLVEAPSYHDYFPGFVQVTLKDVVRLYVKSIEGKQTGQIYKLG
jgi:NAD(P)-dependent dehydrogenase (short-subunit alcohol dehydrogenase family)